MSIVAEMSDVLLCIRRLRANLSDKAYTWFEKELMIKRLTQLRNTKRELRHVQPLNSAKLNRHENNYSTRHR